MTRILTGISLIFILLVDGAADEKTSAQGFSAIADNRQGTAIYLKETIVPLAQTVKIQDISEKIEGNQDQLFPTMVAFTVERNRMESLPLRSVRKALENSVNGPLILIGTRLRIMPFGVKSQASETSAQASARSVDPLWFYASFMEYVEKLISNEFVHIQIDFVTWPESIPAFPGIINWSLRSISGLRDVLGGDSFVRWEKTGGGNRDRGVFDVRIHLYSFVWVPTQIIRPGDIVTEDLVEPREVDLSQYAETLLSAEEFSMFTAVKNLSPGIPIPQAGVTKQILVRAGDAVMITFVRKNLSVQMRGRALSTGGFEEAVTVRPEGLPGSFHGSVSGQREVRIEFR
jgi:flagella basal body P-ring formation protein FlgA